MNKFKRLIKKLTPQFCKPRIEGTWEEICDRVYDFRDDCADTSSYSKSDLRILRNTNGFHIRFEGITDWGIEHGFTWTRYVFTFENIGMIWQKRNSCFYDTDPSYQSGQMSIPDGKAYQWSLMTVPDNMRWIDMKELRLHYRVGKAKLPQHKYY